MGAGCGRSSNDQFAFKPVFTAPSRTKTPPAATQTETNPLNSLSRTSEGKSGGEAPLNPRLDVI